MHVRFVVVLVSIVSGCAQQTPSAVQTLRADFPTVGAGILSAPPLRRSPGTFSMGGPDFSVSVTEDAPGATAFWVETPRGEEEWLLTQVPADGVAARWTIEGGQLQEHDGVFTVVDALGVDRFEIVAPVAYVEGERPVKTFLSAAGPVLAVHVDAAGALALVDPEWRHLTPTLTSRRRLAAVLLPDGRVLAAGGTDQIVQGGNVISTPLNTAEIYDPLTAKWSPATNTMRFVRDGVSATVLLTGQVLITGGEGVGYSELFDPSTNAFDAGSLAAQAIHTSGVPVLLPDGTVLLLVGSAELYTPATNTWATLATQPDLPHALGIVQPLGPLSGAYQLMVGFGYDSSFSTSSQVYDPLNQTWLPSVRVPMSGNLFNAYGLMGGRFANGTIMVHGGDNGGEAYTVDGITWTTPNVGWSTLGRNGTGGMLPNDSFFTCNGAGGSQPSGPHCEILATSSSTSVTRVDTNQVYGDWMSSASAVLMPSGKVMIIGGIYSGIDQNGLKTVGVFDPATPHLVPTQNLSQGIAFQTATALSTGPVLLAGGALSGTTPSAAAQLYANGTSTSTGALRVARLGHTGTLLDDGRVVVVGGVSPDGVTGSVELYDPGQGTWSPGPDLSSPRAYHTATGLADGTVVVAGGIGTDGGMLKSAERLTHVDGGWGWVAAGAFAGNPRSNHVAVLRPNGRVLVAAGRLNASALNSTEEYDPQTNAWVNLAKPLPVAVYDATATLLPSGAVMVAGGTTTPSLAETSAAAVLEADGGWRALPAMPRARARHSAAVMTNGAVLVAGGAVSTGPVLAFDVFDPETESWSSVVTASKGHESGTVTLLPSGQVAVLGGLVLVGNNESVVDLYDEGRSPPPGAVPVLNPVSGPALPGSRLAVSGTGFAGLNWGTGGLRGSPATNLPIISLERQGNGQRWFAPISNWSATATTATVPSGVQSGWYWVRASVNGLTSAAQPLFIGVPYDAGTGAADAGGFDAGVMAMADAGSTDVLDSGVADAGGVMVADAAVANDAGTPDASVRQDAGVIASADAGSGEQVDGGPGSAPGPGLYGCLCGSAEGSGSSLALFGLAIAILAARRRSAFGLLTALVFGLSPLVAHAEQTPASKAKSSKAKAADKKVAPPPAEPAKVDLVAPPAVEPVVAPIKRTGKTKIAILPLECGPGVKKEMAEIITDAIASALTSHTDLEITTSRDVSARLGFERQRQMLGGGCAADSVACMVEVGNALGVDKIAFGSVARLGGSAVLSTTVVDLAGTGVVRHTERVKNVSEEAFLDAIGPTVAALFPLPGGEAGDPPPPQVVSEVAPSEVTGTHVALTVRGQMSPLNLPLGAIVVHVAWELNESFAVGAGVIIARPLGVMARGTWVPINADGRLRPLVSLEVPVMFSPTGAAIGVGGALGVEYRIAKNFGVGLEVPVSYYFGGTIAQRFWLFGAVTLTGRI